MGQLQVQETGNPDLGKKIFFIVTAAEPGEGFLMKIFIDLGLLF